MAAERDEKPGLDPEARHDGFWAVPGEHGPYPPRPGNHVVPWIDGVPFYERLLAAMLTARTAIWAVVSFIEPAFCFPGGTSWWDLLARCYARGVDVRVLFWRNPHFFKSAHVFAGGPDNRQFLTDKAASWAARWDSSGPDPRHCHHQKAFVIDAGEPDALAFIGGMVLSTATLAHPGHHHGLAKHDVFLELHGPAVVDAEHNFVQRWNQARIDPAAPPWPDAARAGALPLPTRVPPPRGDVTVQLARTLAPHTYPGITQVPDAPPFDCTAGEAAILAQYRAAFAGARRTIYIENQHPGQHALLTLLDDALARGVRVVMIVPGDPMRAISQASAEVAALAREGRADSHRYGPTFTRLAALARHTNFTLVALARSDPHKHLWTHREIYCHAKLCIVDGRWATIGSANFVDLSLDRDHTELNASFTGKATCLPLLRRLVHEHTDGAIADNADDIALLDTLADLARNSRASLFQGGPVLAGCYALDPARYGQDPPFTTLQ